MCWCSEVFPSGRIAPSLVVPLRSRVLLLGKDNIGVLLDQNGKLFPEVRIAPSEAPAVVIQKPYAIALLPKHIELSVVDSVFASLLPTDANYCSLQLTGIQQGRNVIIVSLDQSMYGLFPVHIGAQIVQRTLFGNFEEVLVLCNLLPLEDSTLRALKEQSIRFISIHITQIVRLKSSHRFRRISRIYYSQPSSDHLSETLELKKELYVFERTVNGFMKKQVT